MNSFKPDCTKYINLYSEAWAKIYFTEFEPEGEGGWIWIGNCCKQVEPRQIQT